MGHDNGTARPSPHLTDEEIASRVAALLRGDAATLPDQRLRHMAHCFHCRDAVMEIYWRQKEWQSLSAPGADHDHKDHSVEDRSRRNPTKFRRLSTAASLLIPMAIAAFIFYLFQAEGRQPEPDSIASNGDQILTVLPQDQHESRGPAEDSSSGNVQAHDEPREKSTAQGNAFAINENLEFMVDSQYRQVVIHVKSPANGSSFSRGDDISFTWDPYQQPPVLLKILDNRGREQTSLILESNSLVYHIDLTPGLYYWKLEDSDDLLYVGKFFIGR